MKMNSKGEKSTKTDKAGTQTTQRKTEERGEGEEVSTRRSQRSRRKQEGEGTYEGSGTDGGAKKQDNSNGPKNTRKKRGLSADECDVALTEPAWEFPVDRDALARWLHDVLGVSVSGESLVRGHASPLDYIAHSFFEGADSLAGALATSAGGVTGVGSDRVVDVVVWANRGGGKTFLGAVATLLDMIFKPAIEIRILGGSLEQSRRMHEHLRRLLARPQIAPLVKGRMTERRVRLVNGSEVELLAQSQAAVRGTRVQKLRCDEVELFDPDVFEAAQLTTRSRQVTITGGKSLLVRGTVECLSTMHVPHGVMHRLVEECHDGRRMLMRWGVLDVLERCDERHACEAPAENGEVKKCPLLDECKSRLKGRQAVHAGHVSIDDAIGMKRRVGLATWNAEMLSLRPRRSDAVLPEFDPAVHVVDSLPWEQDGGLITRESLLFVLGMDFGYRAPTVVLLGAQDAMDRVWIVDERVASERVLSEHIARVRAAEWPKFEWVGVDPAGNQTDGQTGKSAVQVLRQEGFAVRDRRLRLLEGVDMIRGRLRPAAEVGPRLYVHRRCANLISSMERYHFPMDKPESKEPEKDGSDHAVDALRYLVQNLDRPGAKRWSWV